MKKRTIGWCAIIGLLIVAVYCEFKIGNTIFNAILDVVLVFAVYYVEQRDTNKKMDSLQDQLHELQERIVQFESTDANHNSSDDSSKFKPTSKVLWEHAVKR
jgi:hypothetical protein